MRSNAAELKRAQILALAHQSKLMIVDGEVAYLNDMATDKELLAFVRLLEEKGTPAFARPAKQSSLQEVPAETNLFI